VREVPAHRGQVPHQRIGDDAHRVVEDRIARADQLGLLQRGFARAAADAEHAALFLDVLEAGDAADVHHVFRVPEPQLEQGQQALAAGEDLRAFAVPGEQRHRLRQRGGSVVIEASRDHVTLLCGDQRNRR